MHNNPNLDLVNIYAFAKFVFNILSGNKILTLIKGHNSVVNVQKLTYIYNNHNLDPVKVNEYAQFDQIPLIRSKDIERKQNFDSKKGP